jgi:hypothetical protein
LYFFLDMIVASVRCMRVPLAPSHPTQRKHTPVRGPEHLRASITARTRPQLFYPYAVSDGWCRRSTSNRHKHPMPRLQSVIICMCACVKLGVHAWLDRHAAANTCVSSTRLHSRCCAFRAHPLHARAGAPSAVDLRRSQRVCVCWRV